MFFRTDPPSAGKVTKVSWMRYKSQGQNFGGPAYPEELDLECLQRSKWHGAQVEGGGCNLLHPRG